MGIATRVIPVLLWDEHGCVKGRQFDKSRRIGSIEDRLRVIERRDVDELIILDVSSLAPRFDAVSKLCDNLFCPVTIGGGVKNVADIGRLLRCGADKVAVNRMVRESPNSVRSAAERFGAQAITAALDVRSGGDDPIATAAHVQHLGAGEILLTSVERDGMMGGYDLDLIRSVSSAVSIPVIAAGGCGSYEHMEQALAAGAHAVASGAFFQFCEATPKGAARHLKAQGIHTRT
jgi:cyclase